jgi:hypothetical protein
MSDEVVIVGKLPSLQFCKRVLLDPFVEKAWMYRQLGMNQTQISRKLGINQSRIGIMLKEREEAARYVDVVDGLFAKRACWEPWHVTFDNRPAMWLNPATREH